MPGMKVRTSRFGEIDVPDEKLIAFPEGMIGFRDTTRFVIFDCTEDGIFKWLQSCDRPEIAFVICEARWIVPQYQIMIGEKERTLLQLKKPEDGAVCLILMIPGNPREATANLLGPIVMNAESRIGLQLVLVNPDYNARHRIFADSAGNQSGGKESPCSS
jgi:flagellar assembly factor FliW